jgi:hypothetical protein
MQKSKIPMQHSKDSQRYKSLQEVQAMIQQYESQLESCKGEDSKKLILQTITRLKRLVENEQ